MSTDFAPFTQAELDRFGQAARNLRWLLEHPGECLSNDLGAATATSSQEARSNLGPRIQPAAALKANLEAHDNFLLLQSGCFDE